MAKATGDGSGDPDRDGECKAGCNAVKEAREPLTRDQIARFLERVAAEPIGTASPALETLLFHGPQVREYLAAHGTSPLDPARAAFLDRELRNSHVTISLAVIDAAGRRRIELSETVPIGEKQHLHPETAHDVTPPEVSFTVQRVGLHHLWTRI